MDSQMSEDCHGWPGETCHWRFQGKHHMEHRRLGRCPGWCRDLNHDCRIGPRWSNIHRSHRKINHLAQTICGPNSCQVSRDSEKCSQGEVEESWWTQNDSQGKRWERDLEASRIICSGKGSNPKWDWNLRFGQQGDWDAKCGKKLRSSH